jgi:N-acetyl-alpha-D-muramate 1-phosphate uridylyltransferase
MLGTRRARHTGFSPVRRLARALHSRRMSPKAIILAAGRGERMRPLTDHTPKPLLVVRGKPLIEWHLEALARAGVRDVVINTAWLEEQFPATLADGSRWGLRIHYATEGRDHGGALETAGGIANALPWLGDVFWVVSGDVYLPGFDFDARIAHEFGAGRQLARLWLVPNPPHHPNGDFGIGSDGLATAEAGVSGVSGVTGVTGVTGVAGAGAERRTWASVGLFRAEMFAAVVPGVRLALRPLLDAALQARRLGAEPWNGTWVDVGTVERLAALNQAGPNGR